MTASKREGLPGLPVKATFDEVAANVDARSTGRSRSINTSALTAGGDTRSAWGFATDARQAVVKASYHVGNTTPSHVDLRKQDFDGTHISLDVTDIRNYDDNPRFFANQAFAEIKASLRAVGFNGAFAVTRRRSAPGEPYMLCAGGNSTLEALRQLAVETGEDRFKRVKCTYREYQGEEVILAQHLGENLARGDMRFWEVAVGVSKLVAMMSAASGQTLTQEQLEKELPKRGVCARRTTIGIWLFSAKRLSALGAACVALTMPIVQGHFQPRLNNLRKLAGKFGLSEEAYWAQVVEPTLASASVEYENAAPKAAFSAAAVCDACETALADHVGGDESLASIRSMLSMLAKNPSATLADLRTPRRSALETLSAPPFATPLELGVNLDPAKHSDVADEAMAAATVIAAGDAGLQPAVNSTSIKAAGSPLFVSAALPPLALEDDPLTDLHEAVMALLEQAEMVDCIRWWTDMPYGFYLEVPSMIEHPREVVIWGSAEATNRRHKEIVWWLLVRLTGQSDSRCEALMDKTSKFYQNVSSSHGLAAVKATAMGGWRQDFEVLHLMADPHDVVMYWMLRVIDRMRVFNAREPERWPPSEALSFSNEN